MFRIEDHTDWQSACRELARQIERFRPLPGRGMRLEKTGSGYRINTVADPGGGGGASYCGYFKVIPQTPASSQDLPSVLIADGARHLTRDERLATPAGIAVINDAIIEVPSEELPINLESGRIWAVFELNDNGVCRFAGYGSGANLPSNVDEKIHFILASFHTFEDNLYFIQQHSGMISGWIFKECDEEEDI